MSSDPPQYSGWLPPATPTEDPPAATIPPREREVPLWAPFAALVSALVILSIFSLPIVALVSAADPDFDSNNMPVGLQLGLTALQSVIFVFAAWITVRLALLRTPREQFGLVRVKRVWAAVGWSAAVFVGFYAVTALLVSAFGTPPEQDLANDLEREQSAAAVLAYFVTICLIAPVVEELFFRGFMFTVLTRRLGPVWSALIVGATFGLMHAGGSPALSLVALSLFGVGLCFLYWRTQSIVPCMALHALNNSISFVSTRDLEPAVGAAIVIGTVGAVAVGFQALSVSRRTAAA